MKREHTRGKMWGDFVEVQIEWNARTVDCSDTNNIIQRNFYDKREDQKVSVLGTLSDFHVLNRELESLKLPKHDPTDGPIHWASWNIDHVSPFSFSRRLTKTFAFYMNDWSFRVAPMYFMPAIGFASNKVEYKKLVALANRDIAFVEQNNVMFVDVPASVDDPLRYVKANVHLATVLTDRELTDEVTMRLKCNKFSRQERQLSIGADNGFSVEPFLETSTPWAPSLRIHPAVCFCLCFCSCFCFCLCFC